MGYGYVLGINDLRDMKEYKKKYDEYDDIYQANYENILLKNRNQSVRKTNSNQGNDEIEGMNSLSNTPGAERNREGLYSLQRV